MRGVRCLSGNNHRIQRFTSTGAYLGKWGGRGFVDGETITRGTQQGLDVDAYLADNDSGTYLEAIGDLLVTGPTGTNVGDVWVVWRS